MWQNTYLETKSLSFSRGERPLVGGMSVRYEAGDAVALVGPNGSGKTSLLRVLAGLAEPSAGAVTGGADGYAADMPRSAWTHLGGHQDGLKGALSVEQNLAFWISYFGAGPGALSIPEALERLQVGHALHLPAAVLSQGQKRRVALARLLVAPRPIWLLDEPTASLDVESAARFAALVDAHRKAGGIVIAATHTPLGLEGLRTLDLADYPPRHGDGDGAPGNAANWADGESYWLEGTRS